MKKAFFLVLVVIASASFYAYYLYNKPSIDVQKATAELYFEAKDLTKNPKIVQPHIDKIIEVKGVISEIEDSDESSIVILNGGIKCELLAKKNIQKGQTVSIKGIYTGFDEMFNEISLKKCHLVIKK